jgi:replication factor C large subunit
MCVFNDYLSIDESEIRHARAAAVMAQGAFGAPGGACRRRQAPSRHASAEASSQPGPEAFTRPLQQFNSGDGVQRAVPRKPPHPEEPSPAPSPPPAQSSLAWTEKYRPKSLDEVVGNGRAVAELRRWAGDWEHGHARKKAVILAGAPGTGKTSAAHALAADMGWGVLELNASDARNYSAIKRVAFSGAVHDTFSDTGEFISARSGGRKLIILDEADQLHEAAEKGSDGRDIGDRGGKRAIVETVARTRQPVVLIVNDRYGLTREGGEALKDMCLMIKFDRLRRDVIRVALRRICELEGVSWTPEALDELSARAGGDLRAAVNDLQSLSAGTGSLRMDSLNSLGSRDERAQIFDAVVDILKGTSAERARTAMRRLDETPEFVLLWLDENVPLEYRHPDDLERAFDMLSRADVFLGRVSRRQQYSLWGYASDLMSAGVALAKRRKYNEFNRYRFPMWLVKRSRLRGGGRVQREVLGRIGAYTHRSGYAARHQMLPLFRQLFESDHAFAVRFARELHLEPEHIAYILDAETISPRVRSLVEAASAGNGERGVSTSMKEFSGAHDAGDEEEDEAGEPDGPDAAAGAGPGGTGPGPGRGAPEAGKGRMRADDPKGRKGKKGPAGRKAAGRPEPAEKSAGEGAGSGPEGAADAQAKGGDDDDKAGQNQKSLLDF